MDTNNTIETGGKGGGYNKFFIRATYYKTVGGERRVQRESKLESKDGIWGRNRS